MKNSTPGGFMETQLIRQVLREHGRLAIDPDELAEDTDLYSVGLSSHATVNVMLGLEDAFEVEFSDELLVKSNFASIQAIRTSLGLIAAR